MTVQSVLNCCKLAMRRWVLAAIGISFLALPATTSGAELRTADPSAAATAPVGHHAIPAHPTDPSAVDPKASPAFVDQLYKELMEWTPPWCPSTTSDASLRGRC